MWPTTFEKSYSDFYSLRMMVDSYINPSIFLRVCVYICECIYVNVYIWMCLYKVLQTISLYITYNILNYVIMRF